MIKKYLKIFLNGKCSVLEFKIIYFFSFASIQNIWCVKTENLLRSKIWKLKNIFVS